MNKKLLNEYILAVDTSSPTLSIALWKGDKYLGGKNLSGPKGASHAFTHELDKLLKKHKVPVGSLGVAGFGLGPGSYTGLRIGLASLKGLLIGIPGLRALGFSSLDLIASGIKKPLIGVLVDARRERIYANFYRREKNTLKHLFPKPLLLPSDDVIKKIKDVSRGEKIFLTGDAFKRYGEKIKAVKNSECLTANFWYPKARNALHLIHHEAHGKNWLKLRDIRPLYMRPSEAEEKWGICYDERDLEF